MNPLKEAAKGLAAKFSKVSPAKAAVAAGALGTAAIVGPPYAVKHIEEGMRKQLKEERSILQDPRSTEEKLKQARANIKYIMNYFKEKSERDSKAKKES